MDIRHMPDLLQSLRQPGSRLVRRELWELSEANQWREYELQTADGSKVKVDPRIAVAAHRRGLVRLWRDDGEASQS